MKRIALTVTMLLAMIFDQAPSANASLIYYDDFSGSSLNSGWRFNSGQGSYSMTGSSLRYYNDGPMSSYNTWATKSLEMIYPFSGTNWEIETKATYHLYWSGTGAQNPHFMVSYDPVSRYSNFSDFSRGGDEWYGANYLIAYYYGNGVAVPDHYSDINLLNPSDVSIHDNVADGTYWYKFTRQDDNLSMAYSVDGTYYNTVVSTTLYNPTANNEIILSAITWATVGSYTDYDYIKISGAVPEPSTVMLMGIGGIGIVALNYRNRKSNAFS